MLCIQFPGQFPGQATGCLDAYGFDRVIQHAGKQFRQLSPVSQLNICHRRSSDQGFLIHQGNFHGLGTLPAGVGSQQGQGRSPHVDRVEQVTGQADKRPGSTRISLAAPGDNRAVVGRPAGPVPLSHAFLRPLRLLVDMTAEAGIGGANGGIERWIRYPETVIGAIVYSHVIPARHMALDTLCTGSYCKQYFALR